MFLALQLGLGLDPTRFRGSNDSRPAIGKFPVDFGLSGRCFGVETRIFCVIRDLVETRNSALALQATHTIDHDECHQRQSQNDQPLSKFHGSSCLLLRRHA
ncbi:hypothetical protein SAMN04487955_104124 [Halomonas korlensis]|uniref:Uncharacterized protein n=1 Tax=Halomonas korlensis TaxID=463301 RepID=A0A1I7HBG3_9GAMM|nr:hypothetical protein SAMN04487955_104124 [Halomonas korlensis]